MRFINAYTKSHLRNILKWFLVIILILLIIFVVAINVFAYAFQGKDHAIESYFNSIHTPIDLEYIDYNGSQLRYARTGLEHDSADMIFFVHGAPGNLDNFKEYLADHDLRQSYKLVAMDRPGYGGSSPGQSQPSIYAQADAAYHIIQSISASRIILVGHSYGCPVVGLLAAQFPDKINGVVMLAPLNDPDSEPIKLYSLFADSFIGRLLMPQFIDVASDEKMTHSKALRNIQSEWSKIKSPVLHIHGQEDRLAPCNSNIEFSKQHINKNLLTLETPEEMGHLLIWLNAGYVKEQILNFIESQVQ